jgi:subtilisin-like proprotein convertase family protein
VLCLLLLAGAWLFWHQPGRRTAEKKSAAPNHFSYTAPRPVLPGQLPAANQPVPARVKAALAANASALRLSNTSKSIGELVNNPHAILLENALIDTGIPLNLSIPKNLQSQGDPGAYIVQSRGPINAAFRALLAQAGAQIVSYIPNDAYLVRLTAAGAGGLAAQPPVQSVIPYEPYYKIQSSLLNAAVAQRPLSEGAALTLGLFADTAPQTIKQIGAQPGVQIVAPDSSPFGPIVRVQLSTAANWTALAALPGVQIVEAFHPRVHANDLSRVAIGVSTDTVTNVNYLGLDGHNVIVDVNDTGIDAAHPDLSSRVFGDAPQSLVDTNGHGTFVAGEIAGNGSQSLTPVAVGAVLASMNFGSVTNANFRGKAQLATLYSVAGIAGGADTNVISDQYLQEQAALTNALISNNSWVYDGDNTYDLAAASYDAATRDALPQVTGSQPVLFVFAAGNDGNGDDTSDPGNGDANSIQSPATAKNVISVGAIQEERSITNSVTNADGTVSQPWLPETSTSYRIAGFSSRGNVGIGIEGAYGRFKPDVAAPGTFIVSTRSGQWDTASYFYQSPTNYDSQFFSGVIANPDSLWFNGFPIVPDNAIGVNITISPNPDSPDPFPTNLPIYYALIGSPFPGTLVPPSVPNEVNIPPDNSLTIAEILNTETFYGFNYAVSNISNEPLSFDLTTTIITTNGVGNASLVLSNLDNTLEPYYRFESGTSMSAADVSGTLALLQGFFTNTLQQTPSPALLKAMLINGARPTGAYNLQVDNAINYEGWGLVNLPNSLPTNYFSSATTPSSIYIQNQSPTNALATGDSHTFAINVVTNAATLRVTLAWTDPPGDPIAAIKLVNSLELIVTNSDNPTNPVVYYGNDIPAGGVYNTAENASNSVSVDAINNVQSVILRQPLGTNYTVTVIGREVNVNAVSAQTNLYAGPPNGTGAYSPNVVQDYALVISSGNGGSPGSFTVTDNGIVSNPAGDQDITIVTTTNQALLNQFVGANSPVVNATNTVPFTSNTAYGNAEDTVGTTNQWHFYVVTNTGPTKYYTNAGFVTFLPDTLSIPRMGVFADSTANATVPQADIDLYVTTDSNLLVLSPQTISNCVNGTQVGLSSAAGVFNGASLSSGGTKYVVDMNSKTGQVYYVGVKSETQMASEYDFIPIFSNIPFSQTNANGDEIINGQPVPVNIPDGSPADPGANYVLGLAIYPIEVQAILVTNVITHQNFGDLFGTLTHTDIGSGEDTVDVLNNHDSWKSVVDQFFIYNEAVAASGSPPNPVIGPSDGPGSLNLYNGQDGTGVWRLTEVDDSLTQTGSVQNFTMFIQRHRDLAGGVTNTIPPQSWEYDYVDVPAGATNLTITATNLTSGPDLANPLQLVIKFGLPPTSLTNADKGPVALTNGVAFPAGPGLTNSLSVGPSDVPPIQPGRYWVGIYNPSTLPQEKGVGAVILPANPNGATTNLASLGSTTLLDDAVTYSDIFVTNTQPIVSMNAGIVVQHPRISDLVFYLISPDGTRDLLMENRGGASTNGAGLTIIITNLVNLSANGNSSPSTNTFNVGETSGTLPITYNFYTVPDEMTVYYGTNATPANLLLDTGFTNNPPLSGYTTNNAGTNTFPETLMVNFGPTNGVTSTYLTIIMNQFGNAAGTNGDDWTYTAGGTRTNFYYLTFTDDTNLTTTPIKFAPPPFVPVGLTNYVVQTNIVLMTNTIVVTNGMTVSNFQSAAAGDYMSPSTVNGWTVTGSQVSVATDPANAYEGGNYLALAGGAISNTLPTVAGSTYTLKFAYRGPGIAAWWRAENNTNDSINGNNATAVSNVTFVAGVVGKAFHFDGSTSLITMPASASLTVTDVTMEAWIYPTDQNTARPIFDYGGAGQSANIHLWLNTSGGSSINPGGLHALLRNVVEVDDANPVVTVNQWNHVAFTTRFLSASGGNPTFTGVLYCNGVPVMTNTAAGPLLSSFEPVNLGYRNSATTESFATAGVRFLGNMDEASIYNRPLTDSEIKAIYTRGSAGKFDPAIFGTSPSQSLAEAQVSVNGQTPLTILGNNTTWQTQTSAFIAAQSGTPLKITGIEPGMLIDLITMTSNQVFAATNVVTNAVVTVSNLYYQPEQSLNIFNGKSAYGEWQLEIQDDRAGAGLTNTLVSWDLQFVFANTNAVPAVLGGGIGASNQFLPAGDIAWYQINVPTNADYATNILLFSSAPVDVWFDTNSPPTTNILLLPDGAYPGGTNGSVVLSTTNAPFGVSATNIYDGQTYYLGVLNTNSFTVNYGVEVNFDTTNVVSVSSPPVLPALANTNINELTTLTVTNTAMDTNIPAPTLTYTLTMVVDTNLMIANGWPTNYATTNPPPVISTNGIITWTPTEAQGPGIYTITTVVTDNGIPPLSATNSFTVTVEEVNTPPAFIYPTNTTVITIPSLVPFTTNCVATDPDIPPDLLTFALVSGPTNLMVSTNGVITWTPVPAQAGTNTVSVSVTDTNFYALTNQSYSVTNIFTIIVANTPPILPAQAGTNINEMTTLTVTNTATDPDSPPLTLSYRLTMVVDTSAMLTNGWPTNYATTNPPPVINSTNGIITWTPSNAQGPGVYILTTVVTDNSLPPLSATNSFLVTVNEVNTAPFWPANVPSQTNYTVNALQTLVVPNTATDLDIPPVPLFYQLSGPTPTNAAIDTNGNITWTPTLAQAGTTNVFTTIVTNFDAYAPVNQSLGATDSFTVIVNPLNQISTPFGLAAITTDGTNLYVRAYDSNGTNYILAATPPGTNITFIYTNLPDTLPLGLAWHGTNLFWIDPDAGPGASTEIFSGDTNGDPPVPYLSTTLTNGSDIASDGTQLFAVDEFGGGVSRLPFDFSSETAIGAARYTSSYVDEHTNTVAAQNGVVYVADSGLLAVDLPQVVSLSTNGGAYASDYAGPPFIAPGGIAVNGGALFVVDAAATNTLWLLPVSGATNHLAALASGPPFRNLQRIAYLNHALYVTDDDTNGFNGAIIQIPLPNPPPVFGGVFVTVNGVTLQWNAPIYDEFQVQWATNLMSPLTWTVFPNIITSTNGAFSFTDTNAPVPLKFYQLILLP